MSRLLGVLAQGPVPSSQRRALCAGDDELFSKMVETAQGAALIAHVGVRPFRAGRWVFAHNGKVEDLAFLRSRTSPARRRACSGDTDSELLFAFLLTRLDERGCTDEDAGDTTDATIAAAACELSRAGSLSFVLTDGVTLYAHRLGRSLFFLERPASESALAAHVVASDRITGEAWTALLDRTLLRCRRRGERLEARFLAGWDPRTPPISDVELPFTD